MESTVATLAAEVEQLTEELESVFDRLVSLEATVLALESYIEEPPEPPAPVFLEPEPKAAPKRISNNPWRR